jgi:hypothetical protein
MRESLRLNGRGEVHVHRLFDVGFEIRLDEAAARLAASAPERVRPHRVESRSFLIPNPPLSVPLGHEGVAVGGTVVPAGLTARLFDFGVVSLRAELAGPDDCAWPAFESFARDVFTPDDWTARLRAHVDPLIERLGPAVVRPNVARVHEDYTVFRVAGLLDALGHPVPPTTLGDDDLERLLLQETRPLAAEARCDLLGQRFSYYEDDLAVLTWNAALVVEPAAGDADVQYVLEFANAQLLELRYYDDLLERELPRMNAQIAEARAGFRLLGRRYSRLLGRVQQRVGESTELIERVDNAFKVTDDVWLARVYSAALEIFRESRWRRGLDRKLEILRHAYEMLEAESQARRAEVLELIIVLLILVEIVLGLLQRGA